MVKILSFRSSVTEDFDPLGSDAPSLGNWFQTFGDLLTVHLSIILVINQLNVEILVL